MAAPAGMRAMLPSETPIRHSSLELVWTASCRSRCEATAPTPTEERKNAHRATEAQAARQSDAASRRSEDRSFQASDRSSATGSTSAWIRAEDRCFRCDYQCGRFRCRESLARGVSDLAHPTDQLAGHGYVQTLLNERQKAKGYLE